MGLAAERLVERPGSTPAEVRRRKRNVWLQEVGRLTDRYRRHKARRLRGKARLYREETVPWKYWMSRATGQIERIERVQKCGTDGLGRLEVTCKSCGCVHSHPARCSAPALCWVCRKKGAKKKRRRILKARARLLEDAFKLGLMHKQRRGGRWSEKLLTLTVPHRGLTCEERFYLLREAWPRFLKELNRLWDRQGAKEHRAYYSVHEWTPGSDEQGHPHMHVWLLCPWIDRTWIVTHWKRACAAAGYRWAKDEKPIVDIRCAKKDQAIKELIKYMTKDLVAGGEFIDPATYARVYVLYDGRRRCQGSRGFMSGVPLVGPCPDCDARFGYDTEFFTADRLVNLPAEKEAADAEAAQAIGWPAVK